MVYITEHSTAATSFASHLFNIWTFLCVSTRQCPGSPCSQNGCTAAVSLDSGLHRTVVGLLYPRKRGTLWTPDFNIVIVRLRTSCYWAVVQSHVYVILFAVWFLSNVKTNFPETLNYSLQYIWVCVHKIMFDSVNYCMLLRNLQGGHFYWDTVYNSEHFCWFLCSCKRQCL